MTFSWGSATRIRAGNLSLECRSWGPPPSEATTLVLLHEGLGSVALWRDFPQRLADATGLGVFAYSRAGYGQSDPASLPRPLDYMTREAVDVLPDVLDEICPRRAILLGHSDGATISAIYCGSVFDTRVRGLVVMAPHFFMEPMGLAAIEKARAAYQTGDLKARLSKYHADPDNAFRGWNDSWLHPDFVEWNVTDVLDYIRVPVLALQGEADQYGTWAQIAVIEERCYSPVDTCRLPDCRHSPFVDKATQTLDEIAAFCQRLERIDCDVSRTA